ncbi:MAG: hypothetical protein RLZZ450_4795 [Pseudomonadota bacterium]|jgi:flagellar basal-body rod modification protein FlgD
MAINGINNTDPSSAASAAAQKSDLKVGSNAMAKDDFMKLLVAQLKNQDPNNPLDTKELVTQLSQLTSVEQLVTMNDKLASLTQATNSMAANQSSGLIGKTVRGTADTVQLTSTASVSSAVELMQNAEKVTVSIANDAGRVVRTMELGKTSAGVQTLSWNGKTDSGERATNGTYKFEIAAKDKNGVAIEADQTVSGIVTGVDYDNGAPQLVIGTTRVPLSQISSISQ